MNIIDKVNLFVNMSEEVKLIPEYKLKELMGLVRWKKEESSLSVEEYLTLILLYKFSGYSELNKFWYIEKKFSNNCWPKMPSYARFIIWVNRMSKVLEHILNEKLVNLQQGLGFIDSTKLETSKPYWWGKVHKKANKGYSSTGEFKGFKLHVLLNELWQVCAFKITSASVHDLTPVKEGLLLTHTGKILADSGYVGQEEYYKQMENNIQLIAKPKASMMENNAYGFGYLPNWEINFAKLYKKRINIERFFSYLKNRLGLVCNKAHSTNGLYTQIYSSLLAAQLKFTGELTFDNIF